MGLTTVSGNTVSGNTMPGTVMNNDTYAIDDTAVCDLLTALLDEEVKQNEALAQLNETLSDHIQNLAESGLLDNLQAHVSETGTETEAGTETGTFCGEELFDLLGTINDTLAGSYETLDSINTTVSGNNAFLDSMDGTVAAFHESYTGQAGQVLETEGFQLSAGIAILFAVGLAAGILLARTAWERMR